MVSSGTTRSEAAAVCAKSATFLLVTFALGACGSLEEIGTSRSERDAGGSAPSNGGPTSPFVDASTPPSTGDGGSVSSMDARVPAIDAGFLDSGTVVDGSAALPDTGPPTPSPPQRVVFVYLAHGFGPRIFTPEGPRDNPRLVNALAPLAPFADRTLVIDGINANPHQLHSDRINGFNSRRPCLRAVAHACPGSVLSGMDRHLSRTQPRTIDHRVAEWLGPGVRESISVVAARSPPDLYQFPYFWITTYDEGENWVPPVTEPAEYLSSLADVSSPSPEAAALLAELEAELPRTDTPEERVRFFARTIAAKIAFDVTRVATWNLAYLGLVLSSVVDRGGDRFDNTPNEIGHDGSNDERLALGRWRIAQLAELVRLLSEMPEGSGSVLDHTLVVLYSDALTSHGEWKAPAIVIGGGAPSLRLGEYITLNEGVTYGDDRMIDVLATIVSALGMNIDGIGPPDEPARILPELLR